MLLLSCEGLERGFDAEPLFRNVGFELFHGERVGLVGPNGVGKTTLMKILAGLDRPDAGEALHAGEGGAAAPAAGLRAGPHLVRRGQERAGRTARRPRRHDPHRRGVGQGRRRGRA